MDGNTLVSVLGYNNIVDSIRHNISLLPGALGDDPFPLEHEFAEGLYIRKITIPKGYFCMGAGHYESYVNFIERGDMSVLTENGVSRVKGPCYINSPAGSQRIGFSHEETVWITVHQNPDNEKDLDVLDQRLHDREFHNKKLYNKVEIDEGLFDAKRFRYLTERIYKAEKPGFWSDWSEEQREIYMSGDWEKFSESRGYSCEEIDELREWLELKKEGEDKGVNPLSLVSDLIHTCAIRSILMDKNGEIELSSHMPTLEKTPHEEE